MTTKKQLIDKAFAFYNGGKGLKHWSYSSTSSPFSKNIINYSFSQEVRRNFAFRYKPTFGNLVNNTVQRLIGDEIWTSEKTKEEKWDRDYQLNFNKELKIIKEKPAVDAKDKFAREEMLNYANDCIDITKKVVKDITGDEKLTCERAVKHTEMTMLKPILGRIDYETKTKFIELKTKPPNIRKVKNKEEWKMSSQPLPTEPTFDNLTQTSFYYMCTKKIPFLVYVNDKEHIIFDQSHELMKKDNLEQLYFKMVTKILLWEKMIMFCNGNLKELAMMCEPPELNHPFYYKDLAPEQLQLINNLWGIKHE
jgi:hypothetical protein|tara:strand:+ start:428 stop:1351 length:924 start_codon:yes stop_codon:yes gene_type:complete